MPRFPALALELTGMSALPEVLYGRNSGHRTDDALGSVRLVVDATGGVEGAFDHDVWGVPDTSVTPPGAELRAHTFVGGLGQRNEGDGLYYARQRWYDANLARWLSADPIGFSGSLNLYSYVGNNPVRYVDPSGLKGEEIVIHVPHDFPTEYINQGELQAQADLLGFGKVSIDRYKMGTQGCRNFRGYDAKNKVLNVRFDLMHKMVGIKTLEGQFYYLGKSDQAKPGWAWISWPFLQQRFNSAMKECPQSDSKAAFRKMFTHTLKHELFNHLAGMATKKGQPIWIDDYANKGTLGSNAPEDYFGGQALPLPPGSPNERIIMGRP